MPEVRKLRVLIRKDDRANVVRYALDGDVYEFVFRRSGRAPEAWYMDLRTADGTVQVAGIALVPGVDLLRQYHHLDVPPGSLVVWDTEQKGQDPEPDEIDDRFILLYVEEGFAG